MITKTVARPQAVMLWDALFAVLVLFPLLTGGIWIREPHLFLELSELGIPVVVVALLGLILRATAGFEITQSFWWRFFSTLFSRWQAALERSPRRTLWSGALLVGAFWSLVSVLKHRALDTHAFDLGLFTNAIWNLIHGHGYVSSVKGGMNLFADHQSPIFWAWVPLFALFPRPETLLISQAMILALGAVAANALARRALPRGHWALAALPLLYWTYLPVRNAVFFDFHPETAMLPLFLAAIGGLLSSRSRARILGGIAFLLALACKESAGPLAVGIGLAFVLQRRFGIATFAILLGSAAFLFDLKAVPPLLGTSYAYEGLYSHLGGGLSGIFLSPFTHPREFFGTLLAPSRLKFFAWSAGPLGFASLFGAGALASAPAYLMLFLSAGSTRVNPIFHYGIEPAIGLLWAWPAGVLWLESRLSRARGIPAARRWVILGTIFFALAFFGRSELFAVRNLSFDSTKSWIRSDLLPCISPDVSVAAPESWVPHLATRPWVQDLSAPHAIDCVLREGSAPSDAPVAFACGGIRVEQLGTRQCLRCTPSCVR